MLKTLATAHVEGKKVLLRIDSDVDIKEGKILDDTRLASSLDTINFLTSKNAQVIIVGHLGRPEKKFSVSSFQFPIQKSKELSLEPIAHWFAHILKGIVKESQIGRIPGWIITKDVSLLENIRFYEGEEDPSTASGQELIKQLSSLGDLFINDAFAVAHRNHASVVGITKYLPSFSGLHLEKEIEILSKVLKNPKRPLVVIIGGAKIETKLPMVEKMHHIADYVLVGGEIAEQTRILAKVQHEKLPGIRSILLVADNKEHGFDITDKSVENFIQVINIAKTIVWNGPLGVTGHEKEYEQGTHRIAEALASSNAYKIVGGGDTLSYLKQHNLLDKFDFVSTGGGAMLEFLSGHKLPALEALEK